jgi:LuxR family maltose regulon positive regulatory protein
MLAWLRALPDDVMAVRPVLSVFYGGALLLNGQLEGAEARLKDAERWLDTTPEGLDRPRRETAGRIVVDEQEFGRLPSAIAGYRAALALAVGDVSGTIQQARAGIALAGPDDHLRRGSAAGLLALAYWTTGDLEAAHDSWVDCMTSLQKAGHIADLTGCAMGMADIRITQGRLGDAMDTYRRVLRVLTEHGGPVIRGAVDMHVGMSELLCERNDLEAARLQLQLSVELGEHLAFPQNPYRSRVAISRMRMAAGELGSALDMLDEAGQVYASDFFPNVRPIAARKARLWILQGRLGEAASWAREHNLSARDELSYLREFEHLTFARLLLAQSARDRGERPLLEATDLLTRLLAAAEAGGRSGTVIDIVLQQALAHQMAGEAQAAQGRLERALAMAEPEGYVRLFVDAGPSMAGLLEVAAKRGVAPAYVRELLAAFGRSADRKPMNQGLVEPLSERELDVLRLLATDLDGPGIARELVVSLNTVRTHTKNIYAKLGANSRRAAVRRAEELDLLSRARDR